MQPTDYAPYTLLNPHVGDWVAEPLSFRLLRRRPLRKYGYLLSEPQARGLKVNVLICNTLSGLIPSSLFMCLPSKAREVWLKFELGLWKRINDLSFLDIHFEADKDLKNQPLVVFSWKNTEGCGFKKRLPLLATFPKLLINLSHYYVNTAEKAACIRLLPQAQLWSENDIKGNPYFRHFFGWYQKEIFIVPFCVQDRFKLPSEEKARSPKLVATGSFHFLPDEKPRRVYEDLMRFFGATNYHYIRNDLYQRKDDPEIQKNVEVLCAPYREKKKLGGWLQRLLGAQQKSYFSLNIVEVYQTHRFAAVGEERSGNPGIGIFEAMACGAIPVIEPSCYQGIDFDIERLALTYSGDVASLLEAIRKAPEEKNALQRSDIAAYVEKHCRSGHLWDLFLNNLKTLS